MAAWWYVENDQQTGPIELDELTQLLRSGRIGSDTLLWRDGLDGWYALRDVEELSALRVPPPPPPYVSLLSPGLPPGPTPAPAPATSDLELSPPELAGRWPRFLARIFDVWLEVVLAGFILGIVVALASDEFAQGHNEWMNSDNSSLTIGVLFIPIALVLDALIYGVAGNTPGKALLGLKAVTVEGGSLTLGQYFKRNFLVWRGGFGFGLPLVSLITMAHQSRRLDRGEQASYDGPHGFQVRSTPLSGVRKVMCGFAFAGLMVVVVVLNVVQRPGFWQSWSPDYSWQNPLTQLTATINPNWKNSVQTNADGQQVYTFNELTDRAVVILAREQVPGFSLSRYVGAYKISTAANMRFSDDGRYVSKDGRQVWQGTGSMTDKVSNRLNVEVIETGTGFWRLITIQTGPPVATDALVTQLHSALSNTIK